MRATSFCARRWCRASGKPACRFLAANQKLIAKVEELEHKSRRQDVLVDDELIYAFYDQQVPQDVCSGASFERWYRTRAAPTPSCSLTRDELMRHEAAGITTSAFPKTVRLGGVDCTASYLHEPGDPRDGITVTVPLFVLNQVSEERCEWLVPGMLRTRSRPCSKACPSARAAALCRCPNRPRGWPSCSLRLSGLAPAA